MDEELAEVRERVASLEATMRHLAAGFDKLGEELESLKAVIWKSVGGATVVLAVVNFIAGRGIH